MIAAGIDPGESTGIVLIDVTAGGWKLLDALTIKPVDESQTVPYFALKLEQLLAEWGEANKLPDVACVEDYDGRAYGDAGIGKLVGVAVSAFARLDIPVICKYPHQTKAVTNCLLLDHFQGCLGLRNHERDAFRTVVACLAGDRGL